MLLSFVIQKEHYRYMQIRRNVTHKPADTSHTNLLNFIIPTYRQA